MNGARRCSRLLPAAVLAWAAVLGGVAGVSADAPPQDLRSAFAAAAQEYGVPENVLLAVSYHESRWEAHAGQPSTSGGFGPMHLTDVSENALRGPGRPPAVPALHTARLAAELTGRALSDVKSDTAANVRGGAALLAAGAGELTGGQLPDSVGGWYAAVARYSGAATEKEARAYADDVFATLRTGATGPRMRLAADPGVRVADRDLSRLRLAGEPKPSGKAPQCPPGARCDYFPFRYELNDPDNLRDYCAYDTAKRPQDEELEFIVIHDTELHYDPTISLTQNKNYCSSFHYMLRSSDGHIAQTLDAKNVGWHAGNWWVNSHSVGIEQEGFAIRGGAWFSEKLYRSTARLTRYLGKKYGIPLDRGHIIGHDNVPGEQDGWVGAQHWDPGPYWDWDHFMRLVGAPITPTASPRSELVTIKPDFKDNRLVLTGCVPDNEGSEHADTCGDQPLQSTSVVQLRTEPRADAPLVADPYLRTGGSNAANDWGATASTGQQFAVAERRGEWLALWFGGRKAWLRNPLDEPVAVGASGRYVTPKAGRESAGVYGRAYPERAELPDRVGSWLWDSRTPGPLTKYPMTAGQRYVLISEAPTDFYYAEHYDESAPGDRTSYSGQKKYYLIYFNHRIALVKARRGRPCKSGPDLIEEPVRSSPGPAAHC